MWEPWMQRIYGISPRDVSSFTSRELKALERDMKALSEQE